MPGFKRIGSANPDEPSAEIRWNWDERIDQAMGDITRIVEGEFFPAILRIYIKNAPVRTGKLKAGFRHLHRRDYGRDVRVWQLFNEVPYARPVEYGVLKRNIEAQPILRDAVRRRRRTDGGKIRRAIRARLT